MSVYCNHTDEELAGLLKEEDHAAFTALYDRYWDKLFAVAYHRLDDELEAEEAVQDIFMSLWKRRDQLQLSHTLATYLSVAVKYQVITRLARRRRQKEHQKHLTTTTTDGAETTAQWLSEKELREQIEQSIQALPKKCRIIFIMSRKERKTNAQIAMELNIAEKTIEGHITKALRRLRRSLNISLPLLVCLFGN